MAFDSKYLDSIFEINLVELSILLSSHEFFKNSFQESIFGSCDTSFCCFQVFLKASTCRLFAKTIVSLQLIPSRSVLINISKESI